MIGAVPTDKANEILQAAREAMMERGYNGFSFRDIAARVGIRSASIHYHFATKADLAEAALKAYREDCAEKLAALDKGDAPGRLRRYGAIFVAILREQGNVCLGGILAADAPTLPPQVLEEVRRFFKAQHKWVADVLRDGQLKQEVRSDIDPNAFAGTFVSSIEGAMVVARSTKRTKHLEIALDQLIQLLQTR